MTKRLCNYILHSVPGPVSKKLGYEGSSLNQLSSMVNAIIPAYAAKQDLITRKTSIRVQKIDNLPLKTHSMASARFLLQDSVERVRFFEETYVLVNISMEIVLKIHFLALNNASFQFSTKKLTWRSYIMAKALPTINRVELINKKKFAKAILDKN